MIIIHIESISMTIIDTNNANDDVFFIHTEICDNSFSKFRAFESGIIIRNNQTI